MDTAVYDQTFQRNPCNLSANRIKTGQYDCFGRIVYGQFYTCQRLKSTYVPSLPADNPTLHLIAWKLYD